ncbi:MAG: hypothetical protein GYA23_09390 [Methanomicrobiales archaeon]|nr:hypothetical protein [Methanomicrobiales archaeon]
MKRSHPEDALALAFIALLVVLGLILIVGGVLYFQHSNATTVAPVPSGQCTCADVADLENRLGEANAAIAEYQAAIGEIQAMDVKSGKKTMYSDELYTYEQENVQLAINGAYIKGARSGTGDTDTACETTINAPTPCLKGSFQTHENVHSATCQKVKQDLGDKYSPLTTDYRESLTMEQFWNDEIAAYSAEIRYINENLPRAKADTSKCQWTCIDDGKSYDDHAVCEKSCRGGLGKTITTGYRCKNTAKP